MSNYKQPFLKYLNNYAEKLYFNEIDFSQPCFQVRLNQVIVIPIFDEPFNKIQQLLEAYYTDSHILFILILNAHDQAEPDALHRTRRLYKDLNDYRIRLKLLENSSSSNEVVLVNCCEEGRLLSSKQAVGMARKIGCDMAAYLIYKGHINSRWIHSTDADVRLPPDYFSNRNNIDEQSCSVAIYPFYHQPDVGFEQVSQLYEQSLRYYVKGLERANSPYAFNTIGSLLKIDVVAYAAVRGFPKRSAGEDFYLLNKLAKVGKVITLEGNPVVLAGRPSERVPFGTGSALRKIQELREPCEEYLYYHPAIFNSLRWLLFVVNQLSEKESASHTVEYIAAYLNDISPLNNIALAAITASLHSINFQKILTQASNYGKTSQAFLKQFHNGFDGFKTLKFIHSMRDEGFPSINQAYLKAHCSWFTVTENLH